MSGEVYDITKRAVNAYINTGSIPQYVATQVERDVSAMMARELRAAKAEAWEEGHNHCFHVEDPRNPDRNPYR